MNNNFNNMDDLFNQLMGNMGGYRSENRRYMINGREVTPEEFAIYRQTGQLPGNEGEAVNPTQQQGKGPKQDGILAKLGRNLTEEAREGKLDPVIGRNKEIQEACEILARRTKNNPVLVGDAGVGKTAVVEGLAQAIVNGDVPAAIKNKEIISIDISGLEAGTQYRGSFEENIQNLVNEVKEAGNIILFFDEIHQILGAGSTGDGQGSKGLADILKPALSRGELTVIGATIFIRVLKHKIAVEPFWALQDVSFELKRGDSLGVIGLNGSGKSTLLKLVSGILKPTKGTVETYGSIAPLIELGAGFDPELSAVENIYLNGAVLGYSHAYMEERVDSILDFAELEEFRNIAIKNFSSGMTARLGFAIATMNVPDILILDEILAVGDYKFQEKSFARTRSLIDSGATLLLVSHSGEQITKLCSKALWLDKGHVKMYGPAEEVCRAYSQM